jgi:NAD(P)-dependent dehydrogenase (short-subunit alcohol dehydrogenase family)
MSNRFAGKVLLTTGGGSGLAAAVARRFAREGGRVAVLDIDGARARSVAAELQGSIGMACDVASEDGVRDAVATAHRELGRIDCVFNAAGHADFGPIEEWTLERWNRMMGVHVGGTFLVCKNVLPITRQLAREAAPLVRVNVVAPGRIRSGMTEPLWKQRGGGNLDTGVAQAAAMNMLQRVGEPDDIAAPVCFLFSDESAFMTGTMTVPDGGETLL